MARKSKIVAGLEEAVGFARGDLSRGKAYSVEIPQPVIKGIDSVEKLQRLKGVLRELGSALPGLEIRDYWDADLCAVGVAPTSVPTVLFYVSIHGKRPGHVYYAIEEGGTVVEEADGVPVSRLIAAIQSRLGQRA